MALRFAIQNVETLKFLAICPSRDVSALEDGPICVELEQDAVSYLTWDVCEGERDAIRNKDAWRTREIFVSVGSDTHGSANPPETFVPDNTNPEDLVEFPASWDAMPPHVQRYLASAIVARQLAINDTPAALLKFVFRGQTLGARQISHTASVRDIWPLIPAEARAWCEKQDAKKHSGVSA